MKSLLIGLVCMFGISYNSVQAAETKIAGVICASGVTLATAEFALNSELSDPVNIQTRHERKELRLESVSAPTIVKDGNSFEICVTVTGTPT